MGDAAGPALAAGPASAADTLRSAEDAAVDADPSDTPASAVQRCPLAIPHPPREVRLTLVGRGGPYVHVRYEVHVNGRRRVKDRYTDDEGTVTFSAADGDEVTLKVWFDEFPHPEIYRLRIRSLPAVETDDGLAIRLRNLGAGVPPSGDVESVHIRRFQRRWGLPETGTIDEDLRAAVKRIHVT
ncbi:MAG: hypothetical protein JWM41_2024 [Gemmatimonadetes bacterium]|nr:hypothetical protein [Gemmatimonadota bacterium]